MGGVCSACFSGLGAAKTKTSSPQGQACGRFASMAQRPSPDPMPVKIQRFASAPAEAPFPQDKVEAIFHKLDKDETGCITKEQLAVAYLQADSEPFEALGIHSWQDAIDFTNGAGFDENGKLTEEEFTKAWIKRKCPSRARVESEPVGPDGVGKFGGWTSNVYYGYSNPDPKRAMSCAQEAIEYAMREKNPELLRMMIVAASMKLKTHELSDEDLVNAKEKLANMALSASKDLQALPKVALPSRLDPYALWDQIHSDNYQKEAKANCGDEGLRNAIIAQDPELLKRAIGGASADVDTGNAKQLLANLMLSRDLRSISRRIS